MQKKIYDFEQEETNNIKLDAFRNENTNTGPELDILHKQREQNKMENTIVNQPVQGHHQPQAPMPNPSMQQQYRQQPQAPHMGQPQAPRPNQPMHQQPRQQQQMNQQMNQRPVQREPQEVIQIVDSLDDEFDAIMEKTRANAVPTPLASALDNENKKRKVNWFAILFGAIAVLLAVSLIFVSTLYFGQVAENAKMQQAVKEAEEIKRNNNSQITTLTKQKEDVDTKMKEAVKEKEELQKKLTEATTSSNDKQRRLDEVNKAKEEADKKIVELEKQVKDLQDQIDKIKKAAGSA